MGFSISTVIDDIASTVESTLLSARTSVPDLSPAQWVQILYILATALVVAVAVLPKRARTHLLSYGARASKAVTNVGSAVTAQEGSDDGQYRDEPERDAVQNPDREDDCGRVDNRDGQNTRGATDGQDDAPAGATENTRSSDGVRVSQPNEDDWFAKTMAYITSRGQIPHSWFAGFYVVSLAWSLFWLVQYVTDGRVLHYIASRQAAASAPGMRPGQVPLLWTLMLLQGLRRFTESTWIFKPGKKSTMWVVHWLLGIVYYTNMSVTIWIEGSEAILERRLFTDFRGLVSPKTVIGTLVYVLAATQQYKCHKHLAGLVKYSLPTRGAFRILICPHYSFECLVYLSMAVAGAPEGTLCNRTLLCGLLFVATNLGVTAGATRKWYEGKFGADAVKKKWNIIPLVY